MSVPKNWDRFLKARDKLQLLISNSKENSMMHGESSVSKHTQLPRFLEKNLLFWNLLTSCPHFNFINHHHWKRSTRSDVMSTWKGELLWIKAAISCFTFWSRGDCAGKLFKRGGKETYFRVWLKTASLDKCYRLFL